MNCEPRRCDHYRSICVCLTCLKEKCPYNLYKYSEATWVQATLLMVTIAISLFNPGDKDKDFATSCISPQNIDRSSEMLPEMFSQKRKGLGKERI